MREIVVISGKGGTGKTSLCASFAALAKNALVCDLDVDVPDLHIVLDPRPVKSESFLGANKAKIGDGCIGCGQCRELCRFDAVREIDGAFTVDPLSCEGCGVCVALCPQKAISFPDSLCGEWFESETRFGPMVHAKLRPGQENSGKLVSLLKQEARALARQKGRDTILCDGSPGIGCPVISSLSGATLAVCVTEPTLSGIHDCQRVAGVCKHFRIPMGVVINKADLNESQCCAIKNFCKEEGHLLFGEVPFDPAMASAAARGLTLPETDSGLAGPVARVWDSIDAWRPAPKPLGRMGR